jgi:hypothetical protein
MNLSRCTVSWTSNSSMPNTHRKHISIGTPKKNYTKPTRQYGITKYSEKNSYKPVWHIPLLCVQWKTPDDGQRNCPKHVYFYSKNKFEKLVHLRVVCFIIRIYHEARSPERQRPRYIIEQKSKDIKYVANNRCKMQSKILLHKETDGEDSVVRLREGRWPTVASSY